MTDLFEYKNQTKQYKTVIFNIVHSIKYNKKLRKIKMKKISESSDFEASKIKEILESNGIKVFVCGKNSDKTPSTISAGGNQPTVLKINDADYKKAKKILIELYRNENLFNQEIIQQLEQIKHLHLLISKQTTGAPKIFSKKIGMSQSQMYIKLKFLKNLNAQIQYDKKSETFFYKKPFELIFQFSLLSISGEHIFELYCSSDDEPEIMNKNKIEYI